MALMNNSVNIGFKFFQLLYLLSNRQELEPLFFSLFDYSLLKFQKHHQLFMNNQ